MDVDISHKIKAKCFNYRIKRHLACNCKKLKNRKIEWKRPVPDTRKIRIVIKTEPEDLTITTNDSIITENVFTENITKYDEVLNSDQETELFTEHPVERNDDKIDWTGIHHPIVCYDNNYADCQSYREEWPEKEEEPETTNWLEEELETTNWLEKEAETTNQLKEKEELETKDWLDTKNWLKEKDWLEEKKKKVRHEGLNQTFCYDDDCNIHRSEKDGARWYPKTPKSQQTKRKRLFAATNAFSNNYEQNQQPKTSGEPENYQDEQNQQLKTSGGLENNQNQQLETSRRFQSYQDAGAQSSERYQSPKIRNNARRVTFANETYRNFNNCQPDTTLYDCTTAMCNIHMLSKVVEQHKIRTYKKVKEAWQRKSENANLEGPIARLQKTQENQWQELRIQPQVNKKPQTFSLAATTIQTRNNAFDEKNDTEAKQLESRIQPQDNILEPQTINLTVITIRTRNNALDKEDDTEASKTTYTLRNLGKDQRSL